MIITELVELTAVEAGINIFREALASSKLALQTMINDPQEISSEQIALFKDQLKEAEELEAAALVIQGKIDQDLEKLSKITGEIPKPNWTEKDT